MRYINRLFETYLVFVVGINYYFVFSLHSVSCFQFAVSTTGTTALHVARTARIYHKTLSIVYSVHFSCELFINDNIIIFTASFISSCYSIQIEQAKGSRTLPSLHSYHISRIASILALIEPPLVKI